MQTTLDCIPCLLKQGIRISKFLNCSQIEIEDMVRDVVGYLHKEDYSSSPPHLAKTIYRIIHRHVGIDDPYFLIKRYYNKELLKVETELEKIIKNSEEQFSTAVKLAITGNIIDFGVGYDIDKEMVFDKIKDVEGKNLAMDNVKELYQSLGSAKTLLYLGDNCGEIVFDKIFIKYLKKVFPQLKVYFGVRGGAIINDVTFEDAKEVGIDKVAEILSNGDCAPGTIIDSVSQEFKEVFYNVDMIISKGQGNYETLNEIDRENAYFLFMSKCDVVSEGLSVDKMSLLCLKK